MDKADIAKSLGALEVNLRMLARRVESAKDVGALKKEVFNLAELQLGLVELLKK